MGSVIGSSLSSSSENFGTRLRLGVGRSTNSISIVSENYSAANNTSEKESVSLQFIIQILYLAFSIKTTAAIKSRSFACKSILTSSRIQNIF